jgi:hypothetical protein
VAESLSHPSEVKSFSKKITCSSKIDTISHYWYLIGEDFESVVREIFDQKLLSESQNRGIITLMFKLGEREDIKNWRPITLLNVDYKIQISLSS